MSDVNMANIEMLLKRLINERLEKATAAALTAAYETRLASYAGRGLPVDEDKIEDEILTRYFSIFAEIQS
jgi:hypothetical protein